MINLEKYCPNISEIVNDENDTKIIANLSNLGDADIEIVSNNIVNEKQALNIDNLLNDVSINFNYIKNSVYSKISDASLLKNAFRFESYSNVSSNTYVINANASTNFSIISDFFIITDKNPNSTTEKCNKMFINLDSNKQKTNENLYYIIDSNTKTGEFDYNEYASQKIVFGKKANKIEITNHIELNNENNYILKLNTNISDSDKKIGTVYEYDSSGYLIIKDDKELSDYPNFYDQSKNNNVNYNDYNLIKDPSNNNYFCSAVARNYNNLVIDSSAFNDLDDESVDLYWYPGGLFYSVNSEIFNTDRLSTYDAYEPGSPVIYYDSSTYCLYINSSVRTKINKLYISPKYDNGWASPTDSSGKLIESKNYAKPIELGGYNYVIKYDYNNPKYVTLYKYQANTGEYINKEENIYIYNPNPNGDVPVNI